MALLTLSPSVLSLYVECPRCFWLRVNKNLERPRGPMPTIMNGLDLVIKSYFNQFREKGELPPFVFGKMPGRLSKTVPEWLRLGDTRTNIRLVGKLDDLLETEPGIVAPIDHKTRGMIAERVHRAVQLQMDVYDLLLGASGYKTPHRAWLIYYIPEVFNGGDFRFVIDVKEVVTNPERGRAVFVHAGEVVRKSQPPEANSNCEFCRFLQSRNTFDGWTPKAVSEDLLEDVPF